MIRYGFACKTIGVPHADLTALTLARATDENMLIVCRHNLRALANMLRYCAAVRIPLMRISSDIIPLASHPQNSFDWRARLQPELNDLRALLAQTGVRVSMHPGQYTVLNSPRHDVVEKAVADLRFHAEFLDALGAGQNARLVLHLGGGYGDKNAAMHRLAENVLALPPQVRDRLSLENDERVYTIADALQVCGRCGLPAIFDIFHHSLNPPDHGDTAYWLDQATETWSAQHGRPKLHYSQQLPGGKPGMGFSPAPGRARPRACTRRSPPGCEGLPKSRTRASTVPAGSPGASTRQGASAKCSRSSCASSLSALRTARPRSLPEGRTETSRFSTASVSP